IEGAFGAVNEQQLIVLEALLANAEKLSVVLENLVEIYQYENGTKNTLFQKHRVLSLIAPVVEKYLTAAHARGVSLKLATVSESLEVECDMREISTLLENLVENAIQHTRTTVTLSVEDTDGKLAFAVADDGMGIDPRDQQSLFSRFYEVSSNGRYPATTGTGLYLCNLIALAHGGSLACESSPGEGTVFRASVPA